MKKLASVFIPVVAAIAISLISSGAAIAYDNRAVLICTASGRGDNVAQSYNCNGKTPIACQKEFETALKNKFGFYNFHDACSKTLGHQWRHKKIEIQRY